jgi:O-antigen/teichoic acid export membrane protein
VTGQVAGKRRWAATEVVRRALTATSFAIVAGFLTLEDFAVFAVVSTAFAMLLTVAQSSADRVLVRTWLADQRDGRIAARLTTSVTLLATGAAAAILVGLGEGRLAAVTGLYGVSCVGQVALWAEENRHRAAGELRPSNRLKTLGEIAPALGRAVGAVIAGTVLGACVGSALGAVPLFILGRRQLLPPAIGDRLRRAGRELAVSSVIGAGTSAYWRIDLFLLAALADARAVAMYALAGRGLELALILPSVYGQLSIAEFIRGAHAARTAWHHGRILIRLGCVLTVLAIALSVPLAAAVRAILNKPMTPGLIALLALTIPFTFYGGVLGNVVYAARQESLLLTTVLLMLALNIAINLPVIPWLGAPGAALTTAVTEALGVGWLAWQLRPTVRRLTSVTEGGV